MIAVVFKEDYPGDAPKKYSDRVTVCGWNVPAGTRKTFLPVLLILAVPMNHPNVWVWSIWYYISRWCRWLWGGPLCIVISNT